MNHSKANIITAMRICGMDTISEAGMYHALFSQGLDCDDATLMIKELISEGRLIRGDYQFILKPYGEKNTIRSRAICNS